MLKYKDYINTVCNLLTPQLQLQGGHSLNYCNSSIIHANNVTPVDSEAEKNSQRWALVVALVLKVKTLWFAFVHKPKRTRPPENHSCKLTCPILPLTVCTSSVHFIYQADILSDFQGLSHSPFPAQCFSRLLLFAFLVWFRLGICTEADCTRVQW